MDEIKPLPGLPGNGMPLRGVIRVERCEKCKWRGNEIERGKFECRESPPSGTSFMIQRAPNAAPHFVTHSAFAIVQPDMWCGKFAPRIEQVN